MSENTKIVRGKTFIPTNNYDLPYLKQWKSNHSLSLLCYSNFCKQKKYKIMKWLSSYPPWNFQIEHFHFIKWATVCCSNRSSGLYPLNQGHMTKLPLSVNKWFYNPPPTDTHTHYFRPRHATDPATSKLRAHVLWHVSFQFVQQEFHGNANKNLYFICNCNLQSSIVLAKS